MVDREVMRVYPELAALLAEGEVGEEGKAVAPRLVGYRSPFPSGYQSDCSGSNTFRCLIWYSNGSSTACAN